MDKRIIEIPSTYCSPATVVLLTDGCGSKAQNISRNAESKALV